MDPDHGGKRLKLGVVSGVYIPVCLNIISILMFLRFGVILGRIGLVGILGLLVVSYLVDFVTTLSLSAVASNGEVKGGGAYYLISRSLGPEFGGAIGLLFYLSQVLNTALNVVGLIDCLKFNFGATLPSGFWWEYLFETISLVICTVLCLAGSGIFAKASNGLLVILTLAILSIPVSAMIMHPFEDPGLGIKFTGLSWTTLRSNFLPHTSGREFKGLETFRDLFGILFPATSGIFAGASMSGDLRNPSKSIPKGTLWAMLSTFIAYLVVILSLAASTTRGSLLRNENVIQDTNIWAPMILAGECAVTFFSALMGLIGAAKLMQALGRDKLFPGLSVFGWGTKRGDEPLSAIFLTYLLTQLSLFADLNQIATFISMGYQMTFFVMNLACFLLRIGSAPNFRPAFKFFSWQTAFIGSIMSAAAMFFIDETYASSAVCLLVLLFLLIHYLSPPKHWGDVSQNLIYHQVRKYLLRLKPEHIKFWRPQIILLINNPRRQTRLISFCNSIKKGGLYILGHTILTDDFSTGVNEAKLQQAAWNQYITEYSRIKAFLQLTVSPSITWGIRNLILSSGLGGMRPNIVVLGFYNMEELRNSSSGVKVPEVPVSPVSVIRPGSQSEGASKARRRRDTSARILDSVLPTDSIKTEKMMSATEYLTILEDLALRYRLNVAVGKGFPALETPRADGTNSKKYIDLWPIQMSAELESGGRSVLTTNFDTYTLILQLGYILHSVPAWGRAFRLRVMVFVEYESEVAEERGRVKALLDKLRIEATVQVFWLSSGRLPTYEAIVCGECYDIGVENMINEVLKHETWWDDLTRIRGQTASMEGSQELVSLANVVESTTGRLGVYNPHTDHDEILGRRRPSVSVIGDLPKNAPVSALSRLGVSMGIHTQSLPRKVFDIGSGSEDGDGSSSESETESTELDFSDAESAASEGDLNSPERQPLMAYSQRRKSHGDAISGRPPMPRRKKTDDNVSKVASLSASQSYGTVSSKTLTVGEGSSSQPDPFRSLAPLQTKNGQPLGSRSAPPLSPVAGPTPGSKSEPQSASESTTNLQRPGLSRTASSSMRFSSHLVPETKIATNPEGSGPSIMFAETTITSPTKPSMSRTNSSNRLPGRPFPEIKMTSDLGTSTRAVSFAEPEARRSAPESVAETGDFHIDIPELLSQYRQRGTGDSGSVSGSSYATQDLPLSFNDLPSRAQHLILNDLIRQQSQDTAVLLTTLPLPEEGTCESEEASIQYLSDVEVLCHELPPTLMVLSNNITVTVSL